MYIELEGVAGRTGGRGLLEELRELIEPAEDLIEEASSSAESLLKLSGLVRTGGGNGDIEMEVTLAECA